MRSVIRYIPLVAVAFVFAACGENSSSPTAPASVSEIRRDEGGGLGVGGSATGGSTGNTDPTTSSTQTITVQSDTTNTSTEGGGLGVGGS